MPEITLKNNFKYNLPSDKRLLLFGANRIGKTLISKGVNEFYEAQANVKSLLFNDEIMQSSFIASVENSNKYIITPFAKEKQAIKSEVFNISKELELMPVLKKHFNEKTTKAYEKFPILSEKINNANVSSKRKNDNNSDLSSTNDSREPIYDLENTNYKQIYGLEFIVKCINKKPGVYRFLEFIDLLYNEGLLKKIQSINDLFNGIDQNVYFVKDNIIKNGYNRCPVCYSEIDEDTKQKIMEDLLKIAINEDFKKTVDYYLKDSNSDFGKVITDIIYDYDTNYHIFISELEESILSIISNDFDKKQIAEYKKRLADLEEINIKSRNFIIKQEDKSSKVYQKINDEFNKFNSFSNANLEYSINSEQLEITFPKGSLSELSMSEQKMLKFAYFRILFLQHIQSNPSLKFVVIIDDPFDSYDDIYVISMVEIVFDLLKIYKDNFDKFIVLSHSFHSLKLLNEEYNVKNINFKFQWLEIFKENKEIIGINDELNIMTKIDKNISDFGFAMKIIDKMRDPYSLLVFSCLLRENSKFNYNITRKAIITIKKSINIHNKFYSIVSEGVNHRKNYLSIEKIYKLNKNLYGFPEISYCKNKIKYVQDIFDQLPKEYKDLELVRFYPNMGLKLWKCQDLMHLLIWKFLTVIKIRRILEKNIWIELSKPKYKTLGDLIKIYDEKSASENYKFYCDYKNLFNSFNHTTTENIPPFLIFHAKYIQEALEKIETIQ
jgi:hypothetical protein